MKLKLLGNYIFPAVMIIGLVCGCGVIPQSHLSYASGLAVSVVCSYPKGMPCGFGGIIVKTERGVEIVRQATNNKSGKFKVFLKPGTYLVEAMKVVKVMGYNISLTEIVPERVQVQDKTFTKVTIIYSDGRKCLSLHTKISTPQGELSIEDLKIGTLIWTLDRKGSRVTAPIVKMVSLPVAFRQPIMRIVFEDGKELWVSPGHPLAETGSIEQLKIGDFYHGLRITHIETKPYQYKATYDLLPAGETGVYWANGVVLGSTLKVSGR